MSELNDSVAKEYRKSKAKAHSQDTTVGGCASCIQGERSFGHVTTIMKCYLL